MIIDTFLVLIIFAEYTKSDQASRIKVTNVFCDSEIPGEFPSTVSKQSGKRHVAPRRASVYSGSSL